VQDCVFVCCQGPCEENGYQCVLIGCFVFWLCFFVYTPACCRFRFSSRFTFPSCAFLINLGYPQPRICTSICCLIYSNVPNVAVPYELSFRCRIYLFSCSEGGIGMVDCMGSCHTYCMDSRSIDDTIQRKGGRIKKKSDKFTLPPHHRQHPSWQRQRHAFA